MIGKRALQLTVHALLITICVINLPDTFEGWPDLNGIAAALILGIALVVMAGSIKLNWQLLRQQKITIKPPRTSPLHFGLIVLSPIIIDFSGRLNFSHDSHLSSYELSAELPRWLSLTEHVGHDLGIVYTDTGICIFLFYVFIFILVIGMYTWGWFLNSPANGYPVIQRSLSGCQIALGTILVSLVFLSDIRVYEATLAFIAYAKEDDGLINTWNIGRRFFDFANAVLLSLYAVWIFRDGLKLWKASTRRGHAR